MKTTGLNFIEAVQAAKAGKRIRRASWALNCAVADVNNYFYYIGQNDSFFICIVDILADDWEIVPEPPKTMTFMEAWTAMKEGKKVKRLEMPQIYRIDKHEIFRQDCHTSAWYCAGLHFIDIEATDWIVVEETTNQQEANNE